MNNHYEDTEQATLFDWAAIRTVAVNGKRKKVSDFMFAIPNGGKRNVREAARFKRQGVKPGVSDVFLALPVGKHSGLWIEMKKQKIHFKSGSEIKRAATDNQVNWLELMISVGYKAVVCFGFQEAKIEIEKYIWEL